MLVSAYDAKLYQGSPHEIVPAPEIGRGAFADFFSYVSREDHQNAAASSPGKRNPDMCFKQAVDHHARPTWDEEEDSPQGAYTLAEPREQWEYSDVMSIDVEAKPASSNTTLVFLGVALVVAAVYVM